MSIGFCSGKHYKTTVPYAFKINQPTGSAQIFYFLFSQKSVTARYLHHALYNEQVFHHQQQVKTTNITLMIVGTFLSKSCPVNSINIAQKPVQDINTAED